LLTWIGEGKPAMNAGDGFPVGRKQGPSVVKWLGVALIVGLGSIGTAIVYLSKLEQGSKNQKTDNSAASASGWDKVIANTVRMKLVRIPPGAFTMGSPKAEQDAAITKEGKISGEKPSKAVLEVYRCEGPQHEVEITREFWLGAHEVTQKQFKEVMGYNPSRFSRDGTPGPGLNYIRDPAEGKDRVPADTGDFPVENVSHDEAVEFCQKLTKKEADLGRTYRLPTEAEWEYACRGGAPSYQVFHFGDSGRSG
jgi:formylglycine-generating enzyme required for sulfatase activity